jgi:hypothetical protein
MRLSPALSCSVDAAACPNSAPSALHRFLKKTRVYHRHVCSRLRTGERPLSPGMQFDFDLLPQCRRQGLRFPVPVRRRKRVRRRHSAGLHAHRQAGTRYLLWRSVASRPLQRLRLRCRSFCWRRQRLFDEEETHFDLPFSLAEGEVVYLGTLKISAATGKNIFGMRRPAPRVLLLPSAPDEAIANALQQCPDHVRTRPVRNGALHAAGTNPSVRADPQP